MSLDSARPASRKIHAERALLRGWGRALLLQFAHPRVAQGIVDHSGFLCEKRGRWGRLRRTLDAMLVLTYGTADEAAAVARGINTIHDRVHSRAAASTGDRLEIAYSAHDPELLRWVHATLVDSFIVAHELYVARLSPAEKNAYCAESAGIEPLLGIPNGFLPRTSDALERYMGSMLAGAGLAVTEPARRLAGELFTPVPRVAWPLMALARLAAIGLLPAGLRADYGFTWSARHETALRLSARAIRAAVALAPTPLRHWPSARIARRRADSARARVAR
jgi:uncharacterized protein (DUF2236 family)